MNRQLRDLKRALLDLAAPHGADLEIEQTGRQHYRAVFSRGATKVTVFAAGTPGDRRALVNDVTRARRKLRTAMPAVSA